MDESEFQWVAGDGALSMENWQSFLMGGTARDAYEYPLFSDASLDGEILTGFGPYTFLNALLEPVSQADPRVPAGFLRVQNHVEAPLREMNATWDKRYHGGHIQDEIAALLSLGLGIRLKAGSASRFFQANGDPKGRPWGFKDFGRADPLFVSSTYGPVLPSATGTHDVALPDNVAQFYKLAQDASVAVIRAARLYQNGIWVAEADPSQGWLLLVSAVETAAVFWRKQEDVPIERLRTSRPELERLLLDVGGPALAAKVADMIAPYMGSTKRFVDFLLRFLPEPPSPRPPEYAQHAWTDSDMKKSFVRIYEHRSNALHGGIPFPAPMCWPARRVGDSYSERPGLGGSAAGHGDNVWMAKDIPMPFHTFEYIARNALLSWWRSMLEAEDMTETEPSPE